MYFTTKNKIAVIGISIIICSSNFIFAQEGDCPKIIVCEGKSYNTIQIGNQCWLKENLDVGTMIQASEEMLDNSIIEKYCYDNDSTNCETYGGLYQWNEAMQYSTTLGAQGICPEGWHIPTYIEFQALLDEVNSYAKSLLARGQGIHIDTGTLISGFSALLAGSRLSDGYFLSLGEAATFWSSSGSYTTSAYRLGLNYFGYFGNRGYRCTLNSSRKTRGFCVRCLKD
jgi:uncharacterized protein (TIGR02145 family)